MTKLTVPKFIIACILTAALIAGCEKSHAQVVSNTPPDPTVVISSLSGLPDWANTALSLLKDEQAYFGTNTTLTLDGGALYVNKQVGGLLALHLPLPVGTAGQVSVGLGMAYLDHQFYSANLSLKAGTTIAVPLLGSVFTWTEMGPTMNLHDHSLGSQVFVGATKGVNIFKNTTVYGSVAVGNISFEPGAAWLAALSATVKF